MSGKSLQGDKHCCARRDRVVAIISRNCHFAIRALLDEVGANFFEPWNLRLRYISYLINASRFALYCKLNDIDVFITTSFKYPLLSLILGGKQKIVGLGVDEGVITSDLWKVCDLIIARSNFVKDILIKKGVSDSKIDIVYSFSLYENEKISNKISKEDYSIYIANEPSRPSKGYSNLVEILRKLQEINVYHLGNGSLPIKVKNISSLGFLTGKKFKETVSKARVCIHPSNFDSFAVAPLDALHLGTLPIVSDRTGIAEILPEELVAGSIDEFIDKILFIYDLSDEDYIELLKRTLFKVREKISRNESIRSFKESMNSIMDGRN